MTAPPYNAPDRAPLSFGKTGSALPVSRNVAAIASLAFPKPTLKGGDNTMPTNPKAEKPAKSKNLQIRMSEEELAALEEARWRVRKTASEFARDAIAVAVQDAMKKPAKAGK